MIDKIKEIEKVSRHLDSVQEQRDTWNSEVLHCSNTFINKLETTTSYIETDENGIIIYCKMTNNKLCFLIQPNFQKINNET